MSNTMILLAMLLIPFGLYWAASLEFSFMVYLLLSLLSLVMALALRRG